MATIIWSINRMDVYPTFTGANGETLVNCVSKVYWTCSGTDTDVNGDTISALQEGYCNVPYDPDHPYIAYSDLSESEVLEWVWNFGTIQETVECMVGDQLNKLKTPETSIPLPW